MFFVFEGGIAEYPSLNVPRSRHSCGLIIKDTKAYLVVAGGYGGSDNEYLSSTEVR